MDKATFENNLKIATEQVIIIAKAWVINEFPPSYRYFVYPNCSNDEGYGPVRKDEERFPQDSELGVIGPIEIMEVANFLWRYGRIPQWINLFPRNVDEQHTFFNLICCGRFVGASRRLYHEKGGVPPFNCLGPDMPPSWSPNDVEKFDLNQFKV